MTVPAPEPATADGLLTERARRDPERLAAVDEHRRTLTFADLDAEVSRAAGVLAGAGVRAGDVVSWQLPTRLSTLVVLLALSRLGAVQNPLVPMLGESDLAFICRQAGSAHLIVPSRFRGTDHAAMAASVAAGLDGLAVHVVDDEVPAALSPCPAGTPAVEPADGVRWLFYTSGTTSEPKGARHTDGGMIAASGTFCTNLRVTAADRTAVLMPLAHIGGIAHVLTALRTGSALVMSAVFDPATSIDLLAEQGVTLLGSGVPFIRAYLARQAEHPDRPLFPDVRATLCGGSGRPPELHDRVRRVLGGVGVVSGYGMTECPYLTWGTPDDTDSEHATGEGRPGPATEIVVVRADGSVAAPGEEGELRVRAAQMMLGYVDAALDAEAFDAEGRLRTGDLGSIDAGGTVRVTGRLKDVIIRKMENIPAPRVEAAVATHPLVADVAVIGLPDAERGELACAVVVPADPTRHPTLDDLAAHLRDGGLSTRMLPERLEIVDALPRNAMNKVVKRTLVERYTS